MKVLTVVDPTTLTDDELRACAASIFGDSQAAYVEREAFVMGARHFCFPDDQCAYAGCGVKRSHHKLYESNHVGQSFSHTFCESAKQEEDTLKVRVFAKGFERETAYTLRPPDEWLEHDARHMAEGTIGTVDATRDFAKRVLAMIGIEV